jgi:nitroreductase
MPDSGFLVALTSIHWRESWKYGLRAYRYCQHDVGHALGALALAASSLGWTIELLNIDTEILSALLGIHRQSGPEREVADCLVWISAAEGSQPDVGLIGENIDELAGCSMQAKANQLSRQHQSWPAIDEVHQAVCSKSDRTAAESLAVIGKRRLDGISKNCWSLIQQRRSAVAMDGVTPMAAEQFYSIMQSVCCLPSNLNLFNGEHLINLIVFVHRVNGVEPGLYALVRGHEMENLREALHGEFLWTKPDGCPDQLGLYLLAPGDAGQIAKDVCCFQDIAADGSFSVGMLADFEGTLSAKGAGYYARLYWECGLIGQILYLEAEAIDLRGTGIGCFHDDQFHDAIGVKDLKYQCLYHFTIGGPLTDDRIVSLAPYAHIENRKTIPNQEA